MNSSTKYFRMIRITLMILEYDQHLVKVPKDEVTIL